MYSPIVPHVRPSNCQSEWIKRVSANQAAKTAAKGGAAKISLKRQPAGPKAGYVYTISDTTTIQPIPFSDLV